MSAGLNTNFSLSPSGGFQLSSGQEKAQNRLWMLGNFDKLRVYTPDYDLGLMALQQKNASYLVQFRQIILYRVQSLIQAYCPDVVLEGVNIYSSVRRRKEYAIVVQWRYQGSETSSVTAIFI